jgi:hypothetical protein
VAILTHILKYKFSLCSDWTTLSDALPSSSRNIWTIRWKDGGMSVSCNGEEKIRNFIPSDTTCSGDWYSTTWKSHWSKSKRRIRFSEFDTASLYFRQEPEPG